MSETAIAIRTEVHGLEVQLADATLLLAAGGASLMAPIVLNTDDAERLRMELAKAQLWEWNQLEALKTKMEKRYRYHLGSWLVLCLAAFSAYIGYPGYYLPLFLSALSIFIWWTAGHEEQKTDKAARAERNNYIPQWSYFQQRAEESITTQR
jgi:hypothetical protein